MTVVCFCLIVRHPWLERLQSLVAIDSRCQRVVKCPSWKGHSSDKALRNVSTSQCSVCPEPSFASPCGRVIHRPLKLATTLASSATGDESSGIENVTSLVSKLVPLVLISEDDRCRHGIKSKSVVVFPQGRADGDC